MLNEFATQLVAQLTTLLPARIELGLQDLAAVLTQCLGTPPCP